MIVESVEKWDARLLEPRQDASLPQGVVGVDIAGLCDDLQSSMVVSVDLGGDTAGNVAAILIRADPLT